MQKKPTTKDIITARHAAGQTQTEAAKTVFSTLRAWQYWESGERAMPIAHWILYLLLTGQIDLKNAKNFD